MKDGEPTPQHLHPPSALAPIRSVHVFQEAFIQVLLFDLAMPPVALDASDEFGRLSSCPGEVRPGR